MDPLVRNMRVQETIALGQNLRPVRTKIVAYMVGDQGPFTLRYNEIEYSPERVEADIQKEIETLRAIGALPPQS